MKNKKIIVGLLGILLVASIFLLSHYKEMKEENQLLQNPMKAKERVPFDILEPMYLPDDFELIGVRMENQVVMLIYEDSTGRRISISEQEANGYEHRPYPGEEVVTINGMKGFFSMPGPYNLLWTCNNLVIALSADLSGGKGTAKDEMLKIAKSFQC